MKTKQQLREHLHTYAQIGVTIGLLMGAIDLWGEDLQAKESALLEQVLTEELTAYEIFESLSTMAEEVSDNATPAPDKTSKSAQAQPSARPSTLSGVNLAKLQSQNSEFIAWLQIPGTSVNYPVVQTSDTAFYLTHNFKRQKAKAGTLFSLPSTDYRTPGKNIVIYGHHLSHRPNAMFSPLLNYKQAGYRRKHSKVLLDSIFRSNTYRVFAVVNWDIDGDWVPMQTSFSSTEEFTAFVQEAQRRSLYDTGVSVPETAEILTLITCDRSFGGANGRLAVMAVKE